MERTPVNWPRRPACGFALSAVMSLTGSGSPPESDAPERVVLDNAWRQMPATEQLLQTLQPLS